MALAAAFCLPAWSVPSACADPLPGTAPLTIQRPLDEVMIEGIDRFLLRKTDQQQAIRRAAWTAALADAGGREAFCAESRNRLREILGVVDARVPGDGGERLGPFLPGNLGRRGGMAVPPCSPSSVARRGADGPERARLSEGSGRPGQCGGR